MFTIFLFTFNLTQNIITDIGFNAFLNTGRYYNWERWSIYYKQAEKDKGLILLASDNEG